MSTENASRPGGSDRQPLRMIATDIDGTMLRSDGTLSTRVKSSLAAAVDAGLHVVPATGRPVIVSHDVIEASELADFWVFANGAITRHLGRDELIRGFWMELAMARTLVETVRRNLPGARFALEFEQTVAYEAGFERVVPVVPSVEPTADVLTAIDDPDPAYGRIQKILVFDLTVELDDLFGQVERVAGEQAVVSYSGLPFVELAAGQVTKATALALLADDLGLSRSQVACFGDNHNDLSMLQWAGWSYAMGNATDDAKEAADEIIGVNDDDGLAVKIEELLADL